MPIQASAKHRSCRSSSPSVLITSRSRSVGHLRSGFVHCVLRDDQLVLHRVLPPNQLGNVVQDPADTLSPHWLHGGGAHAHRCMRLTRRAAMHARARHEKKAPVSRGPFPLCAARLTHPPPRKELGKQDQKASRSYVRARDVAGLAYQ